MGRAFIATWGGAQAGLMGVKLNWLVAPGWGRGESLFSENELYLYSPPWGEDWERRLDFAHSDRGPSHPDLQT